MSDLVAEDFNGDTYLAGAAGEREESKATRVVVFPQDMPFGKNDAFNPVDAAHQHYLELVYRLNYHYLVDANVAGPAVAGGKVPAADVAMRLRKIAYLRTLSARMGHYDYLGTALVHHARYAEYVNFTWAALQTWMRAYLVSTTATITDLATALATVPRIANNDVDEAWRNEYRPKHLNVVCMVAYFFRVRGHHWLEDMDDRYKAVWHKCLYEEDTPGLDWKYIAHDALHAIFVDNLDVIWENAANNEHCAGALQKRYNSFSAGVAVVAALNAGVNDLKLIVPRALDYVPESVQHLADLNHALETDRYAGSVNRRLYNGSALFIDETKLAPLAAIIRAGLESFAPNSPLLKSLALKRVANNAPMTGGIIGKMVSTAARSDAAAEIFLPAIQAGAVP